MYTSLEYLQQVMQDVNVPTCHQLQKKAQNWENAELL